MTWLALRAEIAAEFRRLTWRRDDVYEVLAWNMVHQRAMRAERLRWWRWRQGAPTKLSRPCMTAAERKAKSAAKTRRWREANRAHCNAQARGYRAVAKTDAVRKERQRETRRAWLKKNRAHCAQYLRAWRAKRVA